MCTFVVRSEYCVWMLIFGFVPYLQYAYTNTNIDKILIFKNKLKNEERRFF